jgi:hypothetical protein
LQELVAFAEIASECAKEQRIEVPASLHVSIRRGKEILSEDSFATDAAMLSLEDEE